MKWARTITIALVVGTCPVLVADAQTKRSPVSTPKPIGEGTYRAYTWYRALKLGLAPYVDPALVRTAETGYGYQLRRSQAVDASTRCRLLDALVKGEAAIAVRGTRGEWEISEAVQTAYKADYTEFLQARARAQHTAGEDRHRRHPAGRVARDTGAGQEPALAKATAQTNRASSNSVRVVQTTSDASSVRRSPESMAGPLKREGKGCGAFTQWLSQLQGERGDVSFVGLRPEVGTLAGERVVAWDARAFASAWAASSTALH